MSARGERCAFCGYIVLDPCRDSDDAEDCPIDDIDTPEKQP